MKMSVFIATLLWIVIPVLVFNLLALILSGGDQLGFFLVGFYSLSFVCWCIFLSFSFLLGYKAGGGAIIAVPVLVLIAGIYLWQSFGSWNEPGTLWWQAGNVALFFTVLFSVGLLCKYGIKTGGIIRVGAVVVTVITVFVSIMISLSNLCGAYSPLPEELFWKDAYPEKTANGTVYFHDKKIIINPFDSRVIGIFRFDDKGNYVGFSSSQYEIHKIVNSYFKPDSAARASTCDFIHDRYVPLLNSFMADCSDALYVKKGNCCIFLYLKNDTLHRKEFDYHDNGVVKQARAYTYDPQTGFHIKEGYTLKFDELGFCDKRGSVRWRLKDFRTTDSANGIERHYGQEYDPTSPKDEYTAPRQAIIDRFITVESQTPAKKYSSLHMPLDEYYKLGDCNGNNISVHVKRDAYKWLYTDTYGFTCLKTVKEMIAFVDALELSRVETGMWERIGEQSHVVGDNDECHSFMIRENVKEGKKLVFYFFDDHAVTVDSRFSFYPAPDIHPDATIREEARESWQKMKDIFAGKE
jgi:hypothetical protein